LDYRYLTRLVVLRVADRVVNPELDGVIGHQHPTPHLVDMAHPQRHGFAPPHSGVCQDKYEGPVIAGFVGQPSKLHDRFGSVRRR
jgi:hypothetical protein